MLSGDAYTPNIMPNRRRDALTAAEDEDRIVAA